MTFADATCRDPSELTIVGNGVIALAIGLEYRRRRPDARILIVGPDTRPGAASPAAAAMLAAYSELQCGDLSCPIRSARFELARRGVSRWPAWITAIARRSNEAIPTIRHGVVVVGRRGEEAIETIESAALADDVAAVRIDPAEIPGYHPRIAVRDRLAVQIDAEASIDPIEAISIMDRASILEGIERLDDRVVSLGHDSMVLASHGRLPTRTVVVANGAHAGRLLATRSDFADLVPPIQFGIGVAVRVRLHDRIRVPDRVVRTPNRAGGHGTYFVPHGSTRCYVGATNQPAKSPREFPRVEELRTLVESAMDEFSIDLGAAECRPVIGHRPLASDGRPILGRLDRRTWVATGTGRDGLTCAPEIANRMVESILSDEDAFDTTLRPRRVESKRRDVYSRP